MIYLLHQAVDNSAENHPHHEAVRCYDKSLTYAELAAQSNSLAQLLVQQGVQIGDRIGVFLHKSLETAVAIWGIMKAGAAYVPIDPTSPASRLSYIIDHCGIDHLITQDFKRRTLGAAFALGSTLRSVVGVTSLDGFAGTIHSWDDVLQMSSDQAPDLHIIEQDIAYIMYTSGSTGEPKGITHTHHSGLSYARWGAHEYGLHKDDRIANHAPLHFDISTYDWFAGALVAATVVVIPEEHMKMPASYTKLLADERISVIFTVPFALIQASLRGVLDQRDLSALRWIIFGGEPFPTKHLRNLMKQVPESQFSNVYGPAEVNGVTFYHLPATTVAWEDSVPIGVLCFFAQARVVDEQDRPVEAGEIGQLLIRSPTMMQGYWNQPALNKRAFLYDTIANGYTHRYYRTGDLVRLLPDGNYAFHGRQDRQIKTRGFRVELDEVEAKLLSNPLVEEAAVYHVPDIEGHNVIQAAAILVAGATASTATFSRYLLDQLPWYAVPAKIIIAEDFPRTSSGKIARRTLQQQAVDAAQSKHKG